MTDPPVPQQPSGQQSQDSYGSGTIVELEYKLPEDPNKPPPKKSRRGLKILAVFAVLVVLMVLALGILALILLWPHDQVLELEDVQVDVWVSSQYRHWKVSGTLTNIGDESLAATKIEVSVSGAVVDEKNTETLVTISTDPQIMGGTKKSLAPGESSGFVIYAPVEESTQTTRPVVIVRVYFDGNEMDYEDVDVGGKW